MGWYRKVNPVKAIKWCDAGSQRQLVETLQSCLQLFGGGKAVRK